MVTCTTTTQSTATPDSSGIGFQPVEHPHDRRGVGDGDAKNHGRWMALGVAVAVSVFTPEFLSDFGASTIMDLVGYAPNAQADFQDTQAAATTTTGAFSNETGLRVRGLASDPSRLEELLGDIAMGRSILEA